MSLCTSKRTVGASLSLWQGLLAVYTPVWLFYGQAGAITKPILLEKEIKILGVWQG